MIIPYGQNVPACRPDCTLTEWRQRFRQSSAGAFTNVSAARAPAERGASRNSRPSGASWRPRPRAESNRLRGVAFGGDAWLLQIAAIDQVRLGLAVDHGLVHDDLADVLQRRQLVHGVEQHMFEDGAQAARARLAFQGAPGDRVERLGPELDLDVLHLEHLLELAGDRVLRLGQDLDQRSFVQFVQRRDYRQAADEFRDQPVFHQVFRFDVGKEFSEVMLALLAADLGPEADAGGLGTLLDDLLQPRERATDDEQDVARVHLQEFLLGMLAPALRRHRGNGAFDQLQQRLLHAFAGDVAGNGRVLALARDLVYLVNVDDAGLRLLDVVVALLQQLLDDVLDVLAHVTGLGQRGRVGDRERHVQQSRQRLGQQRLAAAGRADQQDVGLRQLDVVVACTRLHALVVVVHRYRQRLLGAGLPDHVLVERFHDLARLGQLAAAGGRLLFQSLADAVVAQLHAFIADEHARARDQLADLVLALAAEGAVKDLAAVVGPALPVVAHLRKTSWYVAARE